MRQFAPLILFIALLGFPGCSTEETPSANGGGGAQATPPDASAMPGEPAASDLGGAPATPKRSPQFDFASSEAISDEQLADYHVALRCSVDGEDVGTMTLALWSDRAPITTRNFLRLCDEGFYDGLTFHRVLRDFMVQGGDPLGSGSGSSPYGSIVAEFSDDPERVHEYGVVSMARSNDPDSASCQFFIVCHSGPSAWGLDGKYTSFGRLTSGVATLEALAEVPTRKAPSGEPSMPLKRLVITRADAVQGPAPSGEEIDRPLPDLGDEPRTVVVQHVLISFLGVQQLGATRSKEEAEALAADVLARARAGEDFDAMIREYTSDYVEEGDETPGTYKINNRGVRVVAEERKLFGLTEGLGVERDRLAQQLAKGEITQEQAASAMEVLLVPYRKLQEEMGFARDGMVTGFSDVAFSLKVGEIGVADFEPQTSPFGWHIIKRIE